MSDDSGTRSSGSDQPQEIPPTGGAPGPAQPQGGPSSEPAAPPPPPPGAYPPPPPPGAYPPPPPGGQYPPPPGAYPPPGYGVAPVPRAFAAGDALAYGWRGFQSNIAPLAVIALVVLAANMVINWFGWLTRDGGVSSFLLSLVSGFISLVISLGLIRAALTIVDGRSPEVGDLLSTRDIVPYLVASLLVSVLVFIGLLLCVVPGLIAGFLFQFFGYAIVDKKVDSVHVAPQSDPIGAMRSSFQITSQNVGSLIVLAILCLLLNLVGALLCGIGLLVTLPVTAIAIAYAWRFFSHGHIAQQPA